MELFSRSSAYSGYLGYVTGSGGGFVESIRGVLEGWLGVGGRLLELPVLSWRLRGVGVEPRAAWVSTGPYVLSADVEGPVAVLGCDPSEPRCWRLSDVEGRVVVARWPDNVFGVEDAALLAAEHGAVALLLEAGRPRVMVTGGRWGYSFHAGAPTPVPVVSVPRGYAARAVRAGWARVWVDACASESRDRIVVFEEGGRDEGGVVGVGAHIDRWFTGFADDVLGVAQAAETFNRLRRRGEAARLILFNAEESGAPGFASWYWAWGSRWYARLMEASGRLEELRVYVNFDTAGGGGCVAASGAPQLLPGAEEAGVEVRGWECPDCDSMMLALAGVPTLSLHGLCYDSWRYGEVYHTPGDTPDVTPPAAAWKAVEAASRSLASEPDWGRFRLLLEEVLGRGPLRARKIYSLLVKAGERAGWEALYREAARRFLRPIHYGSYRWRTADLEAVWFPDVEVYRRLLKDLERGVNPGEVIVAGWETVLYQTSATSTPGEPHVGSQLEAQLHSNLDRLEREAEDLAGRLIR